MSKLKELVASLLAAREAFASAAKQLVKEEAKEFFAANPDIKAVAWVQYAPYFNDGEPCEFHVHDIYATTDDPKSDEFEVHDLAHGEGAGIVNEWSTVKHAGAKEFTNLLSSIPEDVMRDIFGDDSLVLITQEGILVEDYDHE